MKQSHEHGILILKQKFQTYFISYLLTRCSLAMPYDVNECGQHWLSLHIEALTKWPVISWWHFQMHFLEWKCMSFDWDFTEVHSQGSKNIPSLVQIMAWHHPGDEPLSEPMMVSLLTHLYASLCLNELMACRLPGSLVPSHYLNHPQIYKIIWHH